MNPHDRLRALLVERSLRIGEFTLASGARSNYYIDARRTTMTAEGQALIGRLGWEAIQQAGLRPTHVGGMTLGADPVAYAVAHHSWLQGARLDAFTVRKAAKEHGTGQRIEGGVPPGSALVVVEDSMTTGGSALQAIHVLREAGCSILAVLTVVDREEGGWKTLQDAGVPLLFALTTARDLLKLHAGG